MPRPAVSRASSGNSDCAERAGIKRPADVKRAVATAEAAGLLMVHVSEPQVMFTAKGREAARPGRPTRR